MITSGRPPATAVPASELGRLPGLLRGVRRRLRLAWTLDTVQLLAPLVAGLALVLVGSAWVTPWLLPGEMLAVVIALGAFVAVVAVAFLLRLPDHLVARAADRGLRTHDAFATALELAGAPAPFGEQVRERAMRLAAHGSAKDAVLLPWRQRRVVLTAVLSPIVVLLALTTNPLDTRRSNEAHDRAQIAAAIAELAEAADALGDDPQAADAVARLTELTERLAEIGDLDVAEEMLRTFAAQTDTSRDSGALAERAAAQGLERSLGTEPLPGTDAQSPAAAQLDALAEQLDALAPTELAAAADRLDALAATQEAGDPAAAAALAAAATAFRAGDHAAAAAALGEAGASHRNVSATAAASAALGESAAAARRAANALSATGAGNGTGAGSGAGAGSGSGTGAGAGSGTGAGAGTGSGAGAGSGSGSGGSGAGSGGGATSTGSGAAGQGGTGGSGATGAINGDDTEQSPDVDTIFDPAHGVGGDELTVGGGQGAGEGGTIGTVDGPTLDGTSRVPIAEAVADYAAQATAAIDGVVVAPSDRRLVGDYFDQLQGAP